MDIALMTEPQLGGTYEQLLQFARTAEAAGCVAFARADHYYSSREPAPAATDAFATLAGLARDTTSITLTVLVTPVTFRHPAVIAKNAATIHEMSGGRFELGVGTGWMEIEHAAFGIPFPEQRERFDRFEDALAYLTTAFSGNGSYAGKYYQLTAHVEPRAEGMPIIIGGSGAHRTPRLAGRYADEYNHFAARVEQLAPKIQLMRDTAAAAGRDPSAIVVSTVAPVFVGRTEQEFQERLAAEAASRDLTPDDLRARLMSRNMPHGTPGQARQMLASMAEAGVSKFYVQWFDLDDRAGMENALDVLLG